MRLPILFPAFPVSLYYDMAACSLCNAPAAFLIAPCHCIMLSIILIFAALLVWPLHGYISGFCFACILIPWASENAYNLALLSCRAFYCPCLCSGFMPWKAGSSSAGTKAPNTRTSATQANNGTLYFHSIPIPVTHKNVIQSVCGAVTAYRHIEARRNHGAGNTEAFRACCRRSLPLSVFD